MLGLPRNTSPVGVDPVPELWDEGAEDTYELQRRDDSQLRRRQSARE